MASGGRNADEPNWLERVVHSGTGQAIRWGGVLSLVLWRWAAGVPRSLTGDSTQVAGGGDTPRVIRD